jgi:NCS1 family nucleobase:cation symporter-1
MRVVVWACFLGFWLLNMAVVWRGVESIRFSAELFGAVHAGDVAGAAGVCAAQGGRFGPMLSAPSSSHSTGSISAVLLSDR